MSCRHCGQPSGDLAFCSACGAPARWDAPIAPEPAAAPGPRPDPAGEPAPAPPRPLPSAVGPSGRPLGAPGSGGRGSGAVALAVIGAALFAVVVSCCVWGTARQDVGPPPAFGPGAPMPHPAFAPGHTVIVVDEPLRPTPPEAPIPESGDARRR